MKNKKIMKQLNYTVTKKGDRYIITNSFGMNSFRITNTCLPYVLASLFASTLNEYVSVYHLQDGEFIEFSLHLKFNLNVNEKK